MKAVDSAPGSHYECYATSIDSSGTLAYFLLNDSESHRTQVFNKDFISDELYEYEEKEFPYLFLHKEHKYKGLHAKFYHHSDFAMVNIDTQLYGVST